MLKNEIKVFNNTQFGEVRVAELNGEPIFCLKDLCDLLKLSNNRKVKSQLDEDVTLSYPLKTAGGRQEATFVNEAGMYAVILRSDSPLAKPIQKWVTSEVLPAIRKSGGYIATSEKDSPELIMARALQVAQQTIDNHAQQLQIAQEQVKHYENEVKILTPKAEYTDEVLQSTSTFTFTQIAHALGLRSVHVFTKKLLESKIIYKQSGQWQPTAKYSDKGYFGTRTAKYVKSDNSVGTCLSTAITEKGRAFFYSLFKK